MKIIEAVRLGVLGVARLSAGLAFALSLTIGVATAASASEDWKEEFISEAMNLVATMVEKAKVSGMPDVEFHSAAALYSSMSGFCTGLAHTAKIPTPEHIVELSVAIHRDFMRGKVPANKTIARLGRLCLNRAEEVLVKSGISQEDVEESLAPAALKVLREIRNNLGL